LPIASSNLNRFSNVFYYWKKYFICNKGYVMVLHLKYVAALPWEVTKVQMLQIWETVQTKCIDFILQAPISTDLAY